MTTTLNFRFFVHPLSRSATTKLAEFLAKSKEVEVDFDDTVRTIEVYFESVSPAYLVTETHLTELARLPWAREVKAFFQLYGEPIKPFPAFTARVVRAEDFV